jgi:hypothetical protein
LSKSKYIKKNIFILKIILWERRLSFNLKTLDWGEERRSSI